MKAYNFLMAITAIAVTALFPIVSRAGSAGGGGGVPERITISAFSDYIQKPEGPSSLRETILNYYKTLDFTTLPDGEGKEFLSYMSKNGLEKDIKSAQFKIGLDNCKNRSANQIMNPEDKNPKVREWTNLGAAGRPNIGAAICFDVEGIVSDFSSRGPETDRSLLEEVVHQMVATTFHEFAHHFQVAPYGVNENELDREISALENQADMVGVLIYSNSGFGTVRQLIQTTGQTGSPDTVDFSDRLNSNAISVIPEFQGHKILSGYYWVLRSTWEDDSSIVGQRVCKRAGYGNLVSASSEKVTVPNIPRDLPKRTGSVYISISLADIPEDLNEAIRFKTFEVEYQCSMLQGCGYIGQVSVLKSVFCQKE